MYIHLKEEKLNLIHEYEHFSRPFFAEMHITENLSHSAGLAVW